MKAYTCVVLKDVNGVAAPPSVQEELIPASRDSLELPRSMCQRVRGPSVGNYGDTTVRRNK